MDASSHIKTTPKDFFLYLGTMAALYVSAVSLLTLWFQYINVTFPDQLDRYYDPYSSAIRFAIASLIIIFPLYIWLTRVLNQDLRAHVEKKSMGVRKWLLYLTLFVAGITIIGDLIALINTFLGGDLTTRFVLKVLAVLAVIGGVFLYYWFDLKGHWERNENTSITIGWIAGAVVLISIISGFFIIGSPQTQRLMRFDQQKVSDLQMIQSQVVYYWQQKETLPTSLSVLEDPIRGFIANKDPQTDEPYGYRVSSAMTFELCAVFNRESIGDKVRDRSVYPPGQNENWQHGTGEICFERTIDPDLYPPLKEAVPVR